MFKIIITSIFIFIIICILIFLLLLVNTNKTNTNENKEKFTTTETPGLNVELVKYPPSGITNLSSINTLNGYYYQTFTSTNGTYTVAYSSISNYDFIPYILFNNDTKITNGGAHFQSGTYNTNTGEYSGNIRCPFIQNAIGGDWILIILPNRTKLKRYGFVARSGLIGRTPGKWELYGTDSTNINNVSNFRMIDSNQQRLNESDYTTDPTNLTYMKNIHSNENLYNTYLFIFNAATNSNVNRGNNYMINFQQILLFGT